MEISLHFGYPYEKVARKKNGGGGESQWGRCNGGSTRQCKISSLKKVAIRARKLAFLNFFWWISEISSYFGYPDEKVAEKKNGGTGHSQ